ncbi:hypothetical protein N7490_008059 [Penicillium lividum]|nr:hypothetical protein N7490_008059 [Penicillium lividum]
MTGSARIRQHRRYMNIHHNPIPTTDNLPEATEPLDTSISRPDTYAARANESASRIQERIARHFEPGISDHEISVISCAE